MTSMNGTRSRIVGGITVLLFAGLVSGCANGNVARFGLVRDSEMSPGKSIPGFSFTENDGEVATFEDIRGDVTVVIFPTAPMWPNCARCREIERLMSRLARQNTPITVVCIATPPGGCDDAQLLFPRCDIRGYATLVALCDSQAQIRNLYGEDAAGKFFVIDSYDRIEARGELVNMRSLERAVRSAVEPDEEYAEMPSTSF